MISSPRIRFEGKTSTVSFSRWAVRSDLQIVFQEPVRLAQPGIDRRIIEEGLSITSRSSTRTRDRRVVDVLKEWGSTRHPLRYPHAFPAGSASAGDRPRMVLKPRSSC